MVYKNCSNKTQETAHLQNSYMSSSYYTVIIVQNYNVQLMPTTESRLNIPGGEAVVGRGVITLEMRDPEVCI